MELLSEKFKFVQEHWSQLYNVNEHDKLWSAIASEFLQKEKEKE